MSAAFLTRTSVQKGGGRHHIPITPSFEDASFLLFELFPFVEPPFPP